MLRKMFIQCCSNCSNELGCRSKLRLILSGRDRPLECIKCGEKLVIKLSYQIISLWIFGIGGAIAASTQTSYLYIFVIALISLILSIMMLSFSPVESASKQANELRYQGQLGSVKISRILMILTASIGALLVLVAENNLLSAFFILAGGIYSTKDKSNKIIILILLSLAMLSFYII